MITVSDGSDFNGICIHAIEGYFDLYSTFNINNNYFKYNLDSLIKIDEHFMCLTKDPDNSFHKKPAGSINSEAENRNYDIVNIFTNFNTNAISPAFNIKCTGRFYLEKICDTCCSKPNKMSKSSWASHGEGSGGAVSQPLFQFQYNNSISRVKSFISGRNLKDDYIGMSQNHPYYKNKIFDIFDLLVNSKLDNNQKTDQAKTIAKDIDEYLKSSNILNCANSAQSCLPCTSMFQMDLNVGDPHFKSSNDVIFEESSHPKSSFSYSTNFMNPYDELNLKYERDKAWVNI